MKGRVVSKARRQVRRGFTLREETPCGVTTNTVPYQTKPIGPGGSIRPQLSWTPASAGVTTVASVATPNKANPAKPGWYRGTDGAKQTQFPAGEIPPSFHYSIIPPFQSAACRAKRSQCRRVSSWKCEVSSRQGCGRNFTLPTSHFKLGRRPIVPNKANFAVSDCRYML
jgi:hypothetical protein